jgi:hypothetical protein
MRTMSLTAAPTLLLVGCGFDSASTGPEEAPALAEPALPVAEPELAGATATTNLWTTRAPLPTARYQLAAGVVNGVLYAIGAAAPDTRFATVQAYSAGSNSWVTKAPLPSKRAYLNGTGTINGVLYVAGGRT